MKKLSITKEQFEKSNYFTNKYGKLAFVSESGKLFKTSKGKVLKFVVKESRRELEPTNGRASFGGKAYVEDDGDGFTLISYDTPVARIERCEDGNGQDFSLLSNDYLSTTTLTHIHSFLHTYGHKDIPTKQLKELDVGETVHLEDPNRASKDWWNKRKAGVAESSKKLVKEGAGAGYTVKIKGLKFGKILDKKYIELKKKYESYHECKVEILPGEYEIEAEDYYNDFFWQEHEIGDRAYAKIDGGVATIAYSCNSYDEDEADMELHNELENQEMDIAFDYGWGWVHADLPKDKPIESDHVDVEGREFYGSIDKIELNAPDLADAVNGGHQSIYDRDEEEDEPEEEDEEPVDESMIDDLPQIDPKVADRLASGRSLDDYDDAFGDGQWHVFDFGPDFDFYERYTVIAPDGYMFFIGSDGGVGSFDGDRMSYSTSDEMRDALATTDRKGNEIVPSELELSSDGISHDRTVSKGLTLIKDKYDYKDEDDLVTESYDDEWTSVGAAFDEFRQRLWKYTRKDRESRMKFFQDCMKKCEEAFKEYHDACVAED